MTGLLTNAGSDPVLPASMRSGELLDFDKPERPRRPRLTAAAATAEVEALLLTDPDGAAATLRRAVDRLSGNVTFLLWASAVFADLAARRPRGGLPDRALLTDAWASLLCTVVLRCASDDRGLELIDRLQALYELTLRFNPQIGYQEQFDTALESFAAAGPRSSLAAANLLTASNPALALQLAENSDDSLGRALVCASANCELGRFEPAAQLFDRLERWGHSALELNLDDRFAWVLAMTEVGRFPEAERVCGETLGRLRLLQGPAARAWGSTPGARTIPAGTGRTSTASRRAGSPSCRVASPRAGTTSVTPPTTTPPRRRCTDPRCDCD